MVKLVHEMGDLSTKVYWAHDFTELMDVGGRISYSLGNLSFGASLLLEDFEHNDDLLSYEFDAQYKLLELVNLSSQFSILDDGFDDTEDLRAFLFADLTPEVQLPIIGNIKPFVGMDTFSKFEERIDFAGINFEPVTNGFIKVEYQQPTEKDVEDVLNIQVVYVF